MSADITAVDTAVPRSVMPAAMLAGQRVVHGHATRDISLAMHTVLLAQLQVLRNVAATQSLVLARAGTILEIMRSRRTATMLNRTRA